MPVYRQEERPLLLEVFEYRSPDDAARQRQEKQMFLTLEVVLTSHPFLVC